jgi:hypothetical protein
MWARPTPQPVGDEKASSEIFHRMGGAHPTLDWGSRLLAASLRLHPPTSPPSPRIAVRAPNARFVISRVVRTAVLPHTANPAVGWWTSASDLWRKHIIPGPSNANPGMRCGANACDRRQPSWTGGWTCAAPGLRDDDYLHAPRLPASSAGRWWPRFPRPPVRLALAPVLAPERRGRETREWCGCAARLLLSGARGCRVDQAPSSRQNHGQAGCGTRQTGLRFEGLELAIRLKDKKSILPSVRLML